MMESLNDTWMDVYQVRCSQFLRMYSASIFHIRSSSSLAGDEYSRERLSVGEKSEGASQTCTDRLD